MASKILFNPPGKPAASNLPKNVPQKITPWRGPTPARSIASVVDRVANDPHDRLNPKAK